MYKNFKTHLEKELQDIKDAGLYKNERIIVTPQSSDIEVEANGKR
ncbi:MAG: glycine C-acetyltransferase, partial [Muribaculaceae bacterium]|nr:glycine C-acetyltransferase [Bacteroidales bacterium]MDY2733590.1 glycine C-acetyltransferase [Muribaculaceae bacterium]